MPTQHNNIVCLLNIYPPASEVSREVANSTHPYMVSKNLSVCLSVTKFDLIYLTQGAKLHMNKKKFAGLSARAVLIGLILPVFAQ